MIDAPTVTVVIPCRNEEPFIGGCLDSLMGTIYPLDKLTVLVVDGMSDDTTRSIVGSYVRRTSFIRLVDNPERGIPTALNIGLTQAKSEIIMRMDAHSTYEPDYITQCIEYMHDYGADNVGGRFVITPRDDRLLSHSIAAAYGHPFGVGNARYRLSTVDGKTAEPMWEDVVPFFACRREVFEKVGGFNEKLARSEDVDFSGRLKQLGFRTLLVPSITIAYYPKASMVSFLRHNLLNGEWAILPIKYTGSTPVKVRHLAPLAFLTSLLLFSVLSFVSTLFLIPLVAIGGTYLGANLYSSVTLGLRQTSVRMVFLLPFVFGGFHFSYGVGSLIGIVKVLVSNPLAFFRAPRAA
jgi:GT2 family glycosyltransferase